MFAVFTCSVQGIHLNSTSITWHGMCYSMAKRISCNSCLFSMEMTPKLVIKSCFSSADLVQLMS